MGKPPSSQASLEWLPKLSKKGNFISLHFSLIFATQPLEESLALYRE
jgi:hypothetical protein